MGPAQLQELAGISIDAIIDRFGERSAARDSAALRDGIRHDMALWGALWAGGEQVDRGHPAPGAAPSSAALAPFPIAAIAGHRDRLASEDDVRQWQQHTGSDFSLTVLPGDHAFIYDVDTLELLLDELSRSLLAVASPALSAQPATRARRPVRRSMTSLG